MSTIERRLRRLAPRRVTLLWGGLVVCLEALAVLLYWRFAPVTPTGLAIYVYPFVWLNVGLWAVATTDPPAAGRRRRRVAAAVAAGYFLVLAVAGGMVGPPHSHGPGVSHQHDLSLTIRAATVPPGWGPAVALQGGFGYVQVMPFQVVGYGALAYLLYVTVLDAAGSAVSGLVGVLACMTCSAPVVVSLATGFAGAGAGVVAAVYEQPYAPATLAYVATVALLYWRPIR